MLVSGNSGRISNNSTMVFLSIARKTVSVLFIELILFVLLEIRESFKFT